MNTVEHDIIYELYKLSSTILPEKADWSINDLFNHSFRDSSSKRPEEFQKLKEVLKDLEKKHAVVFKDDFNSIDPIESKLRELMDSK